MRIRPMFVTGMAGVAALSAVLIVMVSTTPGQASSTLIGFLWMAVFLAAWSVLATLMLLIRQTLSRAVWVTIPPALVMAGLLIMLQRTALSKQLLGSIILATLIVSSLMWWRLKQPKNDAGPA